MIGFKIRRKSGIQLAFLVAGLVTIPCALAQAPIVKEFDTQSFASLTEKYGAHLDVRIKDPEQLNGAVQIYTGRFADKDFSYSKYEIILVGKQRALIPYFQLSPSFKKMFLEKLWPNDRLQGGFWHHKVTYAGFETLWSISQWFTGTGQNHRAIRTASGMKSDAIRRGQNIKIPAALLFENLRSEKSLEVGTPEDPVFTYTTPVAEEERLMTQPKPRVTEPTPGAVPPIPKPEPPASLSQQNSQELGQDPGQQSMEISGITPDVVAEQWAILKELRRELRWGSDSKGSYATYRLKAGEAIYSAVVVRFCGLVRAEDVNRVAKEIIERNGIRDETDLAIGTPIRIPYDYLEPEFKTSNDPEFMDYVRNLQEVSLVQTELETKNLEGVYIILDPGHGGRDPGASQTRFGQVWEDDFVYDIACRIKERLEKESAATVLFTMIDPSIKYQAQDVERFHRDRDEMLLTNPPFKLDDSRVATDGVNLRWVFANHHYEKWLRQGVKPENILFASIHADSLHHSIRGAMIYVPDARTNPVKFNNWASRYKGYREHEGNYFTFDARHQKMSQARSMAFASNFIEATRRAGIDVHKQKPIRTVIHRNSGNSFVPAVVKYNRIPTRSLIEVCNLNNKSDRELMKRPAFRQKMADVFVEAVYETYGVREVAALTHLQGGVKGAER